MADDLVFVLFRLTVDKMRGAVSASSGCVINRSQVVSYLNKITDELKSHQVSKELTLKKHSDDVYAYELNKPTKTIFVRIMPTADISYRIGTINEKGQLVDAAKTDSYPAAVKWIQGHEASDPSRHYQLVASLPNVETPVIVSDVLEQVKSGENNIFVAKAGHLGKVNRIDDLNGKKKANKSWLGKVLETNKAGRIIFYIGLIPFILCGVDALMSMVFSDGGRHRVNVILYLVWAVTKPVVEDHGRWLLPVSIVLVLGGFSSCLNSYLSDKKKTKQSDH